MGRKVNLARIVSVNPSQQVEAKRTISVYQIPELSILVKEGRKKNQLTQTELAQQTGVTTAEVSRIESGAIRKPSKKVLKALSPYIGISYSILLFYVGYNENMDEAEYYDPRGNLIPFEDIINDIYSADADLLGLLKSIDTFTSFDDIKLLKTLLVLMKKTHEQSEDDAALTRVQEIFTATKAFLCVQLAGLLNIVNQSSV